MYFVVKQDYVKTGVTKEMMAPHIEYVHQLINDGIMVFSGPFADETGGGMFVMEVENEETVKKIVSQDPAVVSGYLKNEIRPYNLMYMR